MLLCLMGARCRGVGGGENNSRGLLRLCHKGSGPPRKQQHGSSTGVLPPCCPRAPPCVPPFSACVCVVCVLSWCWLDEMAVSLRREELDSMQGSDVFNSFYSRLRDVQKYHAKFSQADALRGNICDSVKPVVSFSGEEALGRYLDMHALHAQFLNLVASSG